MHSTHRSRQNAGLSYLITLTLAVLAGSLIGLSLSSFNQLPEYAVLLPHHTSGNNSSSNTTSSHINALSIPTLPVLTHDANTDSPSLEELKNMVARTKGYWARDYSLHLGWNNMRYIIETALLHGELLNRTVIIPSFVYARSCEFNLTTCAKFTPMVNHGDAVGTDEWRELPIDEQMAWRIPIFVMLNMTLLRMKQPVITVSEYLRLHNISEDTEENNGHWERNKYHLKSNVFDNTGRTPSLHVIENKWYDPWNINRIDMIPDDMKERGGWSFEGGDALRGENGMWTNISVTSAYYALEDALRDRPRVLSWNRARELLQENGYVLEAQTDEEMERFLNENGWEVLHTYSE